MIFDSFNEPQQVEYICQECLNMIHRYVLYPVIVITCCLMILRDLQQSIPRSEYGYRAINDANF